MSEPKSSRIGNVLQACRSTLLRKLLGLTFLIGATAPGLIAQPNVAAHLVGDFNGDGQADAARWRESDRKWEIALSCGKDFDPQVWTGAWGSDGPINVGDLNGDGKTDLFMWRNSDRDWTVNLSTGSGFRATRWTGAWGSDGPINVGDLNGDGKTDVFMWRNSDRDWTVNLSTGSGFNATRWTGAWGSDGPIQVADLTGDKKSDVFMYRGTDNTWSVNVSTGSGFASDSWTTNASAPTPGPVSSSAEPSIITNNAPFLVKYKVGSPPGCALRGSYTVQRPDGTAFGPPTQIGGVASEGTISLSGFPSPLRVALSFWCSSTACRPPKSVGSSVAVNEPPTVKVTSFKATPDYINLGDSSTLTWNVANCSSSCMVTITAKDGFGYNTLVSSLPGLSATGSLTVSPKRSTHTKYILSASGPLGSDSKEVVVQVYFPPAAQPTGDVFCFKMTNNQSLVSKCYIVAVYDKDEAAAKKSAENTYPGYTAEKTSCNSVCPAEPAAGPTATPTPAP
jgi:hypothetical protein